MIQLHFTPWDLHYTRRQEKVTTHDADISAEIRTQRHNQLFTLRAGGAHLLAEAAGGHLHQWQEEFQAGSQGYPHQFEFKLFVMV